MSVESLTAVLHHSRAKGSAKLVLLGIANHAGDGGAWPTVATLAKYANMTERAVQQTIGKLVQLGELHVHRQAGGSQHLHAWERPNRYDVIVSCPAGCDRSTQHRVRYPQAEDTLPGLSDSTPSDRVNVASPGEEGFTPPGEEDFTQTVHLTQPRADLPAQPDHRREAEQAAPGRVVHSAEPCDVCQLPWSECMRLAKTSGHDYRPKGSTPTALTDVDARAALHAARAEA